MPMHCIKLLVFFFVLTFEVSSFANRDASEVEVLQHEWRPATVWERIGKTQFIWKATVYNRSNMRKRVFVYYDLLDEQLRPLAQNVANRVVDPDQTVEISSDSYIQTRFLPMVKSSRATVRVGFPE